LREQAVLLDLLLRANRDYRDVLPVRIFNAYMRDLRELAANWTDKDFLIAESDGRLLGVVAFYRDASYQDAGLAGGMGGPARPRGRSGFARPGHRPAIDRGLRAARLAHRPVRDRAA
jgi:hypothetical protein